MHNFSNETRCTLQKEIVDKIGVACRFILSLPNFKFVQKPEKSIDILTITDAGGYKPIHYAIAAQNEFLFNTLSEIFLTFPYSPYYFNVTDREGNSPLHWAMKMLNYQAVVHLVRCGADVSKMNNKGRTPLHIAIENSVTNTSDDSHLKMVKFLISVGALVDAKDINSVTPLHTASEIGNSLLVDTLVLEGGAFVNVVDDYEETPLFYAIRKRHSDVVKRLLVLKSNIYARNSEGETPLEYCVALRDSQMIEILSDYQNEHGLPGISFNSPHVRMNMSASSDSNSTSSAMSSDSLSSSDLDMSLDLSRSEEMNAVKFENNNNDKKPLFQSQMFYVPFRGNNISI